MEPQPVEHNNSDGRTEHNLDADDIDFDVSGCDHDADTVIQRFADPECHSIEQLCVDQVGDGHPEQRDYRI